MNLLVENGGIQEKYTSTGRQSGYQVDLYHTGLDEHKHLSAVGVGALEGKIHNQINGWNDKWEKELIRQEKQSKEQEAQERTEIAHNQLKKIETILLDTLSVDDSINWDCLKYDDEFCWERNASVNCDYVEFNKITGYPDNVIIKPIKPDPSKLSYFKSPSFIMKLLGQASRINESQQEKYNQAVQERASENRLLREENAKRLATLEELKNQWKVAQSKFIAEQNALNDKVNFLQASYLKRNSESVVEYCEMVLNNSDYDDFFQKKFELEYNPDNHMLLVEYHLPSIDEIPKINHVRYIKSRDEIEEKFLTSSALAKLFDSAIYQIILRTIHELFEADVAEAIKAININGIVTAISPTTGHEQSNCIVSIQVTKEDFDAINLSGIINNQSYKECFKSLKGVGSAKLSTLTAVKPLLELDKSDKRFKDHYAVADELNDEMNIAAMDWADFEHLVREIFEKEFAGNGGEVKVTQASSDGGVDAVAFDPDPIRGGKIVIQAKRYTNVVGVAAVRDLYGTVLNEGATKGILVTTSDYGADSYNFAKDKPLTLLSGSNLLHLLEKHGHKAKIDIKEAKTILKA